MVSFTLLYSLSALSTNIKEKVNSKQGNADKNFTK